MPSVRRLLTLFALVALAATRVSAQQVTKPKPGAARQWRVIGTTHAGHSRDHDESIVKGPNDDFRKVKIKVKDAGLNMHYMMVTFDNGQRDRIEVRQDIPKNGESRPIDLKGSGKRSIRKIEFWYGTKDLLGGTADVTVVGQ